LARLVEPRQVPGIPDIDTRERQICAQADALAVAGPVDAAQRFRRIAIGIASGSSEW
jgi:hypothetical protein